MMVSYQHPVFGKRIWDPRRERASERERIRDMVMWGTRESIRIVGYDNTQATEHDGE